VDPKIAGEVPLVPPRHPYVLLSQHDRRQRARCYIVREIWTSKKDARFLVWTKPEKTECPAPPR